MQTDKELAELAIKLFSESTGKEEFIKKAILFPEYASPRILFEIMDFLMPDIKNMRNKMAECTN